MKKKLYVLIVIISYMIFIASSSFQVSTENIGPPNLGIILIIIAGSISFTIYFFISSLRNTGLIKGIGIIHAAISSLFSVIILLAIFFQLMYLKLLWQSIHIDRSFTGPSEIFDIQYILSIIYIASLAYAQISYYHHFSITKTKKD